MVKRSVDAGINFFDTADVYSRGQSEQILGRAFSDLGVKRDEIVIATKVRGAMSDAAQEGTTDVNNIGLSRKHIIASCNASLERLGTDHIDLYQIHGWDHLTPLEETMGALDDLVRAGKVRYIGCSNLTAWQIVKANAIASSRGNATFCSLQAYYSLVARELELELLPMCKHEGIGVMVWSPLAGGFITGKFRRGQEGPDGARRKAFDFPPLADRERGYDLIELLDVLAKEKGTTIPRLALSWLLQQQGVSTLIIGAKKMEQLEDNLAAVDVTWTDEQLQQVASATVPPSLYPYWMLQFMRRT
jgi:aryl-alcohol dehydrogenase-like predicted oxidoreductase